MDPVFQKRLGERGIDPEVQPEEVGAIWIDNVWHGRAWSWEKAQWARKEWQKISSGKPIPYQRDPERRGCSKGR